MIYARQVNPEYQESPLDIFGFDGTCYENIILTGNRGFTGHTIPEWDSILQVFDEAAEDLESLEDGTNEYFKNATELIRYHFPESEYRPAGKFYSTRDIHNIREILRKYCTDDYFRGRVYREMLSALTGKEWRSRRLSGCCQGDWIDCIYPADEWTDKALEALEMEYFNTGSEWIIHDENTDPKGPEDIQGFSMYCYSWNTDGIKKEIADEMGGTPADVVLYEYDRPVYHDTWKKV